MGGFTLFARQPWIVVSGLRAGAGATAVAAVFVSVLWWLRDMPLGTSPQVYASLDIVQVLIALTFLANILLRFKGTREPIAVFLAAGFLVAALAEALSSLAFFTWLEPAAAEQAGLPWGWMASRTFPPVLLLAALLLERRLSASARPRREIALAFAAALAVAVVCGLAYGMAPAGWVLHPEALVRRPWQLLPAALFFAAAIAYRRRPNVVQSSLDRAFFLLACWNVLGHSLAGQAAGLLDAPFAAAQLLNAAGYALVLGGALLDNSRLFERVEHLAVSDPLTGLANYRRFMDVLHAETERSARTDRPFSVVLLDLDGLKRINDRYGHLVGSQALCRVADALRMHSRAMDTAARFGGDEFVLVLPETGAEAAEAVARRIRERVAADPLEPRISVSTGFAAYPRDGAGEALLHAADRALYGMKHSASAPRDERPQPARWQTILPDSLSQWTGVGGEIRRPVPSRAEGPAGNPPMAERIVLPAGPACPERSRGEAHRSARRTVPFAVSNRVLERDRMPKANAIRRIETRIPMEVAVQLTGHEAQPGVESTFTENVSSTGARVVSARRWKINDFLWIAAPHSDFRARARVAYCQPLRSGGYALGLEFLQPAGKWVVRPTAQASRSM